MDVVENQNIEEKKDEKPTINEKLIYITDFLYTDPNVQKFCNNQIHKYFSKKCNIEIFSCSYIELKFHIVCSDSSFNCFFFEGYFSIDKYTLIIKFYNDKVKIPIKSKKIISIIDSHCIKINLDKLQSISDDCHVCFENKTVFNLCCGKLCSECINIKTYNKCVICKTEIKLF